MSPQSPKNRIGVLVWGPHPEPDEIELIRAYGSDGRAIVLVKSGGEQILGVDRNRQSARERPLVHRTQLFGGGLEYEHRLAQHGQITPAVGVLIRLADDSLARSGDNPADQERGDVESLPRREITANDDGRLGVKVCDAHRSANQRDRKPTKPSAILFRELDDDPLRTAGTGSPAARHFCATS